MHSRGYHVCGQLCSLYNRPGGHNNLTVGDAVCQISIWKTLYVIYRNGVEKGTQVMITNL